MGGRAIRSNARRFERRKPWLMVGALVNINSLPTVYDLRDEEHIGAFTGPYYLSSSAAAITGPILSGGLIDLAGKNYTTLWLFRAVFMGLAILAMTRVRTRPSLPTVSPVASLVQRSDEC